MTARLSPADRRLQARYKMAALPATDEAPGATKEIHDTRAWVNRQLAKQAAYYRQNGLRRGADGRMEIDPEAEQDGLTTP